MKQTSTKCTKQRDMKDGKSECNLLYPDNELAMRLRLRKKRWLLRWHCLSSCLPLTHTWCLLWLTVKTRKADPVVPVFVCAFFLFPSPSKLDLSSILFLEQQILLATSICRCLQPGQQSRNINKCAHRKSFHTCIRFRSMVHHFNEFIFRAFFIARRRCQFHRKSFEYFFCSLVPLNVEIIMQSKYEIKFSDFVFISVENMMNKSPTNA